MSGTDFFHKPPPLSIEPSDFSERGSFHPESPRNPTKPNSPRSMVADDIDQQLSPFENQDYSGNYEYIQPENRDIDFANKKLTVGIINRIANILAKNSQLWVLNLSNIKVPGKTNDECVIFLVRKLLSNKSFELSTLILDHNQLTDRCAEILGLLLKTSPTLETLSIQGNLLIDKGIKLLVDGYLASQKDGTLAGVYLEGNRYTAGCKLHLRPQLSKLPYDLSDFSDQFVVIGDGGEIPLRAYYIKNKIGDDSELITFTDLGVFKTKLEKIIYGKKRIHLSGEQAQQLIGSNSNHVDVAECDVYLSAKTKELPAEFKEKCNFEEDFYLIIGGVEGVQFQVFSIKKTQKPELVKIKDIKIFKMNLWEILNNIGVFLSDAQIQDLILSSSDCSYVRRIDRLCEELLKAEIKLAPPVDGEDEKPTVSGPKEVKLLPAHIRSTSTTKGATTVSEQTAHSRAHVSNEEKDQPKVEVEEPTCCTLFSCFRC